MLHFTALKNPDFVIVGAGVIGLAAAWELARAGASVEIIDRGLAGGESSWAGGGMLFPLSPWDYPEAVRALTELGRTGYPDWIDELQAASGIDCEYRQTGLLALPPVDFQRAKLWCAARALAADVVCGAAIAPSLTKHAEALWLPQAAQVRNPRLLRALAHALRRRRVSIQEDTEVVEILSKGDRTLGIRTSSGPILAGSVVVCAGAWSSELLADHVAGAKVFPVRGQMLLYEIQRDVLPVMLQKGTRYLIPRTDGHILAGSTEEMVGFEQSTTADAAAELHAAAVAMLSLLRAHKPVLQWAGLRPGSPGNVPTIGRHPRITNLYLNSGHFRYGLTMAPAAAKILANVIAGQPQPVDVAPYAWPAVSCSRVC